MKGDGEVINPVSEVVSEVTYNTRQSLAFQKGASEVASEVIYNTSR